jgi:cytochrome c oxidase assembly factor CtaG
VTWWCSASTAPWSWDWRPYPGVWLFVGLVALLGWRLGVRRQSVIPFAGGLLLLWVALDWPVGPLGGYSAAFHAVQFILLALGAPPLLLVGLAPILSRWAEQAVGGRRWLRHLAHPATGLIGFNLPLFLTHIPGVVDRLMTSQGGSFVIDMVWIASGAMLWWPVVAPSTLARISGPLQMGYLFIQTIPSTVPAAFLVFSDFPLFRLYELAPRVFPGFSAANDHQVAGLLMKTVGDPVIWIGMAAAFFRWANRERAADLAQTAASGKG